MIAGITPGRHGAIAIVSPAAQIAYRGQLPQSRVQRTNGFIWHLDADKLSKLLDDAGVEVIVMEGLPTPSTPKHALCLGITIGLVNGIAASLGMEEHRYWRWRDHLSIPPDFFAAVDRVNNLTARNWPSEQFPQTKGGHHQQLAALLALYAMQMSHVPPPPAFPSRVPELAAA